ncbi:MAG: VOC family protein [Acidobacteria bacterium]|nr:VOC family protein [Acidobacteriota bacterium]
MAKSAKWIPEGHHTVTPYLVVRDAGKAIEFYKRAFGAEEVMRMPGPDGKGVGHAEVKIGDAYVYLADENPQWGCRSPQSLGGSPASLHLYVQDVDAAFKRAIAAGATEKMPVADMFWGDRYGKLADPFGFEWGIATVKESLTPAEVGKRAKEFYAKMAKQKP